jgi:hypothetical protein
MLHRLDNHYTEALTQSSRIPSFTRMTEPTSGPTSEPPVDCGRRLIPKLIDEIACSDPQRPFVSVPRSSDVQEGYEDISYSEFAKAVNRCSWWIEKELGRDEESQTLFYIGPLDLRYLVVLLAAAKTGHIVSPPCRLARNLSVTDNLDLGLLQLSSQQS